MKFNQGTPHKEPIGLCLWTLGDQQDLLFMGPDLLDTTFFRGSTAALLVSVPPSEPLFSFQEGKDVLPAE
jgi:hypothetical protein